MDRTEHPPESRRFRRAYLAFLFGTPWVVSAVGLAMILFGLLANRPAGVLVASIVCGTGMAVAGLALPRLSGQVELGATGLRANLESIPQEALHLVESAAKEAIPIDTDDRDRKARDAVLRAVSQSESSLGEVVATMIFRGPEDSALPIRYTTGWWPNTPLSDSPGSSLPKPPPDEPPDEPPGVVGAR